MSTVFSYLNSKQITNELFDIFYSLLKSGLKREEYRCYEGQRKLLNCHNYNIMFMYDNAQIVGAIAYWEFHNMQYIEHFIVNEKCRNKGYGGKMIEDFLNRFQCMVILEVELPYNEINKRRISFYKRHGFYLNDYEYFQHPLNEGDNPLQLLIMSFNRKITFSEFDDYCKTFHENVYKQ